MESPLYIDKINNYQQQLEDSNERIRILENELKRYKTSADSANYGLWNFDLVTNTPFISVPWKTMLGFREEEELVLDGLLEKLLHPEDRDRVLQRFEEFKQEKHTVYNEVFRMLHTDGTFRWIKSRAKSIKDKSGKVIMLAGSHTDITEIKEAELALRESENKYKMLFQNSLVGIFRSEVATGKIIEANDKVWDIVGKKNANSSLTFDFYKNPKDRDDIINVLRTKGRIEDVELEIRKKNGELIWVLFSAFLFKKEEIIETVIIDITERKNTFLELQKVNFELDNFVYHASHDLRSPLSSILGLLNIYKMEKNPSIQADCIDRIENSIMRLDNLVGDLLSISRNDRVNDPHVDFNFLIEINDSISSCFSGLITKNLDIRVRVKQPMPFVSDLTRVRTILNNLISNAIKYRDLEKPLSIINIDVEVNRKEALLKIEDNGQGIEENKINNIFNMFFRANEKSQGSGLGLYIVKNAIEKLKGEIDLETKMLEGSTFSVVIPNSNISES
ncbi:MAG: PAS domain S-box protein [Cyclobacteriaceae bacterium]|nr:PAS domain S-box protein [Cyclobacteriaceae bacterium]